ncbi:MAG TPA: outer membrane protein transport protein [bacterium]|nr:outer membrane protein transport protein [bacterium]
MNAGAFVTPSDDASACVLNPAALVFIKRDKVQIGILGLFSETRYSGKTVTSKKENDSALLGDIYCAIVPEKSKLRFGIGITSPYGQKTQWKKTLTETYWAYNVPFYGEMKFVTFTPSIALPITEYFSFGSGIDIHRSSVTTKQSVPWSFITGTPDGIATLKGDDTEVSLRIGVHYHKQNHSFGFVWSSPFDMNYSGTFSMTNFPDGLPPFLTGIQPLGPSHFTIKFPEIYSLAYGWNKNSISVQCGVEFVKYSCLKNIKVNAGPNDVLIPVLVKDWHDAWTYSAGIEYAVNNRCSITAGIGFIQSPVPDKTFEPTLSDADRFIYTLGTSITNRSGKFSIFYMYNQFKKRNIQQGGFTDGKYESSGSFVGCEYAASI